MSNARFWAYVNGSPVRLVLRPGQSVSHHSFEHTDEGWGSEDIEWSFDGEFVRQRTVHDGRDCDGRLSTFCEVECAPSLLAEGYEDEGGIVYPAWDRVSAHRRDYAAEAMGY